MEETQSAEQPQESSKKESGNAAAVCFSIVAVIVILFLFLGSSKPKVTIESSQRKTIGDTITVDDISITLKGISKYDALGIPPGYELIGMSFDLKNDSEKSVDIDYPFTVFVWSNNEICDSYTKYNTMRAFDLMRGKLLPGSSKKNLSAFYIIPAGWSELKINYYPDIDVSKTHATFDFVKGKTY